MFKVVKGPLSAIPLPGNAVRPAMRVSGPPRPVKIPHRLSGSAPRHPRKDFHNESLHQAKPSCEKPFTDSHPTLRCDTDGITVFFLPLLEIPLRRCHMIRVVLILALLIVAFSMTPATADAQVPYTF